MKYDSRSSFRTAFCFRFLHENCFNHYSKLNIARIHNTQLWYNSCSHFFLLSRSFYSNELQLFACFQHPSFGLKNLIAVNMCCYHVTHNFILLLLSAVAAFLERLWPLFLAFYFQNICLAEKKEKFLFTTQRSISETHSIPFHVCLLWQTFALFV